MAHLTYKAKDPHGAIKRGVMEAESKGAAVKQLRENGMIVLEMNEHSGTFNVTSRRIGSSFGKKVSDKDRIIFTQQLAIMTQAGLPITQALHSLMDETTNKRLVKVIHEIAADVEGGLALSTSFAKHPNVFSPIYVSVLKAGEKSGKVDEVLQNLATQSEKDYDIKSKVKGALSYPIFVLIAMSIIVSLIMVFIIPQIEAVFIENDAKLPFLTQMVIAISSLMRNQWWILIAGIGIFVTGYRMYYRTPSGKYLVDSIKLRIPIFGTLLRRVAIARFARIFSTLLAAGLPMLEIFETSNDVLGNEVFRREMAAVSRDVENGIEISAAMKKQPHIPHMMTQLTSVGEKSGNIDIIYNNLATFMEKEVDNITRNMTSLLEPALMLIMGAVIGTIVIALLLPIYSLTSSIL